MTNVEIENKIKDIIASKLEVDKNILKLETDLGNDLAIASLDYVEVLIELEKTFNIYITDAEANKVKTVGDIIHLVSTKL